MFLHGFTGSTDTWTKFRSSLESQYRVIAVDLPGHGESSAPDDAARYSLDRFAQDLAKVLDALGIAPHERVAGFVHIGRPAKPPEDRDRPKLDAIVTRFGA